MEKILTPDDIKYVCRSMMGADWVPSFMRIPEQEHVLRILNQCQSKLELMYFLGIGYYLYSNRLKNEGVDSDYPEFWIDHAEGQEGIHISEPFCGGSCGNGFSSLLVIPQYQSPDKPIHHDFGFFRGESNGGGPWHLFAAVEIEGYGVHRRRRNKDEARYKGLTYNVIRLYEETTQPQNWYEVFDPDVETGIPGEYCPYPH